MRTKNHQPNAEEVRWREKVRSVGCIGCGAQNGIEIHHVAGCAATFNKVKLGNWWILPLCSDCHRLMGNPDDYSRAKFGFAFVGRFDCERVLFSDLLTHFDDEVPRETLSAIWQFRR